MPMCWHTQAKILAILAVLMTIYGVVTSIWWTTLTSAGCAVFFGLEVMGVKSLGRVPPAIRRLRERR
jgi:hypothetical protein